MYTGLIALGNDLYPIRQTCYTYNMSAERILVVDDEPQHVQLLMEVLGACGYTVLTASTGEKAVTAVAIEQPDLVILDVRLAGELDGFQVLERIRKFSNLPVIMLTALTAESDMLRSFEGGADDYMRKPFSTRELLARVRAILGRTRYGLDDPPQVEIVCGELLIDLMRRQVMLLDREIYLTPTEYKLLLELARHQGKVLLHEQLLRAVWGPEYQEDHEYLRAYIHYLRRKLEPDPANPRMILRVPGAGYMLVADRERDGAPFTDF